MEPRRGTATWNRDVEPRRGTATWNRDVEPRRGTATWNRDVEPRRGTATWNRDAGRAGGSLAPRLGSVTCTLTLGREPTWIRGDEELRQARAPRPQVTLLLQLPVSGTRKSLESAAFHTAIGQRGEAFAWTCRGGGNTWGFSRTGLIPFSFKVN